MIEVETDIKDAMMALKRAMAAGAGGRTLKRELSKRLRGIMNPLVQEQRSRVLRLPSKGTTQGRSLRQAVAQQTKAATRWSGRNAGVQVIQRARSMPRGFNMAGRMLNREEGWNPTTLGGETRHQEMKPSGWFDEPTAGVRPEIGREVMAALEDTAAKLAQEAR